PAECVDGFLVIVILEMCIAQRHPGKGASVFPGVSPRVAIHSVVSAWRAVLDQLPRHRLQRARGNKCLPHAPQTGRVAPGLFLSDRLLSSWFLFGRGGLAALRRRQSGPDRTKQHKREKRES